MKPIVMKALLMNAFHFIWSTKDESKAKGSGVAIIMRNKWWKYCYSHTIHSPYLIQVRFMFYGKELHIWSYYIPPNNQDITNQVICQLNINKPQIMLNEKHLHIWIGDTNAIADPSL